MQIYFFHIQTEPTACIY